MKGHILSDCDQLHKNVSKPVYGFCKACWVCLKKGDTERPK